MTPAAYIRNEQPADYAAIGEVITQAFARDSEARLVSALRELPSFEPQLSLVAEVEGRIVGHILFSTVTVGSAMGDARSALALAPLAVLPGFQRQGVGGRLVRAGLEVCGRRAACVVIVVGHPDYYPRFGFGPARQWGLEAPFPVRDAAFMAMLVGAPEDAPWPDGVNGLIEYPAPFSAV